MIDYRLLDTIANIYEKSSKCKLSPDFFIEVDSDLTLLSDYFNVTKTQALFISIIFVMNYKDEEASMNLLSSFLSLNTIKVLVYSDVIKNLCSKNILHRRTSKRRTNSGIANDRYIINPKLVDAIIENAPFPIIEQTIFNDEIEVLENIGNLLSNRIEREISTDVLITKSQELINSNLNFPVINALNSMNLSPIDTIVFMYLIWKTLAKGAETTDLTSTICAVFDNNTQKIKYEQSFLFGENALVKEGYIVVIEADFFSDTEIKLTEETSEMLQQFGMKIFSKKRKRGNVTVPADIKEKELVFNEQDRSQLDVLKVLLSGENLDKTQKRLEEKNLPKGVASLFYGASGTGKTEFAYQIARETSRAILKVDISQSKSMWHGESEKIIKRIFTDYKSFAKECDRTPILFFNEADAIISTRTNRGKESNISQTENAMQNILLEELENFDGIFIATTNLASNLDSAFERRFLFKIEFHKPDLESKGQIWKIKLPSLSEKECKSLAVMYDFSGGQIDNIVRKAEMHEILNGEIPTFNGVINFCKTELISKNNHGKIGY